MSTITSNSKSYSHGSYNKLCKTALNSDKVINEGISLSKDDIKDNILQIDQIDSDKSIVDYKDKDFPLIFTFTKFLKSLDMCLVKPFFKIHENRKLVDFERFLNEYYSYTQSTI